MKFFLFTLLILVVSGCHDAPAAPPCRTEGAPVDEHADAGCVIFQDNRMLVLKHRFGGKMGIPGGGAREGESSSCTAHRETWEETGLDVTVGERLGQMRYGYVLYQCHPDTRLPGEKPLELPWHAWLEVTDALWLAPAEIPRDQWRYTDQVDLFMKLVDRAGKAGNQ